MRPISNVVDASNYVMVELGKPIHTFDAAAVQRRADRRPSRRGRRAVRDARPRRSRRWIRTRSSSRTPAARSGSPGSWAAPTSEVTDATTDVIVESAIFDPISIRRTAFRYALRSEASLRFEKGQEFRLARARGRPHGPAHRRVGGRRRRAGRRRLEPDRADRPRACAFRPARVNRLLGHDARRRRAARAPGAGRDRARNRRRPGPAIARGGRTAGPRGRRRATPRRRSRPSRRGAATWRSRPTSPRRSPGSAATRSSRRSCRTRRCRRTGRSPLGVRDAIRETLAGAGLTARP